MTAPPRPAPTAPARSRHRRRRGRDPIRAVARDALGLRRLRPGQREAVQALLDGHDVLAVMPTGSGKSAIYQIAGLLTPGPTVVVSPLIALQRDQVESLEQRTSAHAAQANSTVPAAERREALADFEAGRLEFLLLAPEQLAQAGIPERLRAARPSLLVVDEAHCISSWGHDFRPEYARLGGVADALGRPRVLALTATAAPPVREEIAERLRLADPVVIVRGFDRANIHLAVERHDDADDKDAALLERVAGAAGPGIVYAATRRRTQELAGALADRGVRAVAYHAGRRAAERHEAQSAFMDGRVRVVVATTAFGMGIDKPDVRFVYHADAPDSLDAYHQELGRAGRDGRAAEAVLFFRPEDLGLRRFFASGGQLGVEQLERVATLVHAAGQPVDVAALRDVARLSATKLDAALNQLQQVEALAVLRDGRVAPRRGGPDAAEAARLAAEQEETRRRVDRSRVEMLRGYGDSHGCRREYLLTYFGEPYQGPCGNCDNCDAGRASAQPPRAARVPFPVDGLVRHEAWGEGRVLRYQDGGDKVVVLFDQAGYKTLSVATVLERGLLESVRE